MKKLSFFLLVCAITVGCNDSSTSSDGTSTSSDVWEYKVIELKSDGFCSKFDSKSFDVDEEIELLDALGEEGWELVDTYTIVETVHPNFGNSDYVTGIRENTRTQMIKYVFKRHL